VLRIETLDASDVLRDCAVLLKRTLPENIRLELAAAERLAVQADRGRLEQVVMNLCLNARDVMPDGGVLTLEARGVVLDDEYCRFNPGARRGRYVCISVTDTGVGMDEKTRRRIFEPFFTTKEFGRGAGLGLAVVYGIVQQHQGLVHVYSEKGRGTTFKPIFYSLGLILGGSEHEFRRRCSMCSAKNTSCDLLFCIPYDILSVVPFTAMRRRREQKSCSPG